MEILRDEYLDCLTFRNVRRPIFVELFGPLIGLEDEWRAQGATPDELALTAFGFDWPRRHRVLMNPGLMGGEAEVVLEETADRRVTRDRYGRTMQLCKATATIPLPMDHLVKDMPSWLAIKPRYEFSEERFAPGWAEAARKARAEGAMIVAYIPGGFDEPRQLLGEEQTCLAYYEQPEMMHDMLETLGETAFRVLDRVSREVQIDVLSVHEDMAGKSGPLAGPPQIREFIRPYYRRIWDLLAARGAQVFQMDSDGDMTHVIPDFLDAGINCMYPMEPAAGMDMVAVRRQYGRRLAVMGGIDKHVLRQSREAIRRELEYKLQPLMRQGGTVFGLDHRIPNGTPLANYRYYVKTARELLGLDPCPPPGWARAAY